MSFFCEKNLKQLAELFTEKNLSRCAQFPIMPVWARGGSPMAARFLGNIWVDGVGPSVVWLTWLYGNHHGIIVNGEAYEISFINVSYAHGAYVGDFGHLVYESGIMPPRQEWREEDWPQTN